MECKSKCSGKIRSQCTIGVNDLGIYQCAECGCMFTNKAIFKNLQLRFRMDWEKAWEELKSLKRYVTAKSRSLRRAGYRMDEVVYLNKNLDTIEHSDCIEKQQRLLINEEDLESGKFIPTVHVLSKVPSHKSSKSRF